jgi:hypothetical protein
MYEGNVRISQTESLEIMHQDKTIMVYENIDPSSVFVKPEKVVYPGQPMGLIKKDNALGVKLVLNKGNNQFELIDNYYWIDENEVEVFSESLKGIETFPTELITREMSKKEKRLLDKGKLDGLH